MSRRSSETPKQVPQEVVKAVPPKKIEEKSAGKPFPPGTIKGETPQTNGPFGADRHANSAVTTIGRRKR